MGILDFHVVESLRKYSSQFSIVFVSDCKIKSKDKKKIDFSNDLSGWNSSKKRLQDY